MESNYIIVEYCYKFLTEQISMSLLLYSHIPAALAALVFSIFAVWKAKNLPSILLFITCFLFSIWTLFDLGAWFSFLGSSSTMFTWSLLDFIAVLMFFFAYYFLYVFTRRKDLPLWQKILSLIIMMPTTYITLLGNHLTLYDLNSCVAWENTDYTVFTYYTKFIYLAAIAILTITNIKKFKGSPESKRNTLAGIGTFIFLLFFFTATFLVSLLATSDVSTYVYNYLIYGLFGMPIFLVFLGYLVVRYQAFRMKMFGAQVLILSLIVLVSSQFTLIESISGIILTSATLLFTIIAGLILIKSVKKEINSKMEIEKLAIKLEKANVRLKQLDKLKSEFVSIASHQLRSPITAISGYTSLLREGNYGEVTAKMKEPLERIEQSARMMASSIEDYLNVSRIESGNMKYNYSDFPIADEAEHICDDLRAEALRRGLVVLFKKKIESRGIVHADIGKAQQIIHNLLNNSIKYTIKGAITVYVHDETKSKNLFVDIIDTGVGMSTETINSIFQKFERGDSANLINIKGTGLGLYVALKMAEEMGGTITAHSEGEGKGSRFTFEIPLVM